MTTSGHPLTGWIARLVLSGAILCAVGSAAVDGGVADALSRSDQHARSVGAGSRPEGAESLIDLADRGWRWPVPTFRLEQAYRAPAHRYGAGHRGVDVRPAADAEVLSPAPGVVAFSGQVAGRGILTIDHGDGLVTTLEPIASVLAPGTPIARGEVVGTLSLGGHTAPGALHFGVRLDGEYINPLLLLGGVPRAVLLPCC